MLSLLTKYKIQVSSHVWCAAPKSNLNMFDSIQKIAMVPNDKPEPIDTLLPILLKNNVLCLYHRSFFLRKYYSLPAISNCCSPNPLISNFSPFTFKLYQKISLDKIYKRFTDFRFRNFTCLVRAIEDSTVPLSYIRKIKISCQ